MAKNSKFLHSAVSSRCERILQGSSVPKIPTLSYRGKGEEPPSHMTTDPFVATKTEVKYTGTAMLGVATMHKSNGIPIFQEEDAIAVSSMRR